MMQGKSTAAALLVLACGHAGAVAVQASTAEYIHTRVCPAVQDGCIATGPNFAYYGGTPGALSSSLSQVVAGHGQGASMAELTGSAGAPILKVMSSSVVDTLFNTQALALQSYTYTGAVAATRTFGGALTYSQTMPALPVDVGGVFAYIQVFTTTSNSVEVGTSAQSNFLALASGIYSAPGFTDLGSDIFYDTSTAASGVGHVGVTLTLNPGQTVLIATGLSATSLNGGMVDASHTFVTAWNDSANLVPAAVPEPAQFSLFILGLAALCLPRVARKIPRRA